MVKTIYCAVAAQAWQTLLGSCRAACLPGVRLWCQAGDAVPPREARGAAPLAELLFLYTEAARHVRDPGTAFPLVHSASCGSF